MKFVSVVVFVCMVCAETEAQTFETLAQLQPKQEFENILSEQLYSDSLVTTFVIWIRKEVKAHYHAHHTEQLFVISGKGLLRLGDTSIVIRPGDWVTIPAGTAHSVKVTSRKPLKVLSVQAPRFLGDDRIDVND